VRLESGSMPSSSETEPELRDDDSPLEGTRGSPRTRPPLGAPPFVLRRLVSC
jgi:hypothetical protein